MAGTSGRRLARIVVPPAAALALVAGLAGCKQGQLTVSTPSASTAAPTSGTVPAGGATDSLPTSAADPVTTTPVTTAPAGGTPSSEPAGPGAISVSITSPVTLSGSVSAPVSCRAGLAYWASVSSAVIHGDQLTYSVAISHYRGPGSYPAVVAVTLRQSTGAVTTLAGVARVPAVITATGGSFSVSATSSEGRTFTGSLNWTCGT
jgi:hypothetical protein